MTNKISITSQILEVERELEQRRKVYPRLVGKGSMRQAEAELLIGRMEAVRATLVWVQNNEAEIRAYLHQKKNEGKTGAEAVAHGG